MQKTDWRKELKHLYNPPSGDVVEADVPPMRFLMHDGEGDPNGQPFEDALGSLYAVSYALKFMVRERTAIDYAVSPVEGLWSGEDPSLFVLDDEDAWRRTTANRESWRWTLMVMQPDLVTTDLFEEAREKVGQKKGAGAVRGLRFESFQEGKSAQILHRGPYAEEWPAIKKVHDHIGAVGAKPSGRHHEIYLNDPIRTSPGNLRTVIRQPFIPAG